MRLLNAIHQYDISIFFWINNGRFHDWLAKFCRYLSKTGDGPLYVIYLISLWWQEGYSSFEAAALLLGFSIERPLYFILKNGFKRNRPQQALANFRSLVIPSDQFSFPSGHTSAAFLMATTLAHFHPIWQIPVLLWAGMVGFSRVVLGVHFPTDIIVGCVIGMTTALISLG